MIINELNSFIKRELGDEWINKLNELKERNGIDNFETANKNDLRMFAKDLRDLIPTVSLARRNLLFAEILKILKVQVLDTSKDKLEQEEKIKKIEYEHKKIERYVKDIDKSLSKYEAIFNLFWLRAGEAELSGIKHEEIMKITSKALAGVKKDLEKSREEIMIEYQLLEKNKLKLGKGFNFRTGNFIEKKIEERNDIELKNKKLIKDVVEKLWDKVDQTFLNFKEIFINSMNKEIEIKKQGKDDSELIINTQEKMKNIWSELEQSYKEFVKDMEIVKKNMGNNIMN